MNTVSIVGVVVGLEAFHSSLNGVPKKVKFLFMYLESCQEELMDLRNKSISLCSMENFLAVPQSYTKVKRLSFVLIVHEWKNPAPAAHCVLDIAKSTVKQPDVGVWVPS